MKFEDLLKVNCYIILSTPEQFELYKDRMHELGKTWKDGESFNTPYSDTNSIVTNILKGGNRVVVKPYNGTYNETIKTPNIKWEDLDSDNLLNYMVL